MDEMTALMKRFVAWRKKNGLSQRAAVEVLAERDFGDITLGTLQKWEELARSPGRFTAKCLARFLDDAPVIADSPRFSLRKEPTPAATVAKILKEREAGATLRVIAQKYNLSESGVSRLVKGNRRAAA